ncbi:MAG TPA: hypothetical protein VH540_06080 [Ktedonobacterales bacterium]|jgi:methionine-rich copper-binding protein CopC
MKHAQQNIIETLPASNAIRQRLRHSARMLVASLCAMTLLLLMTGVAAAHALLDRADAARDAILDQSQVQAKAWLRFTEEVNPALSKVAVKQRNLPV